MDLELRNNNSRNNNSSAEAVALVVAANSRNNNSSAEAVAMEAPARQQSQEWGWMQEVEMASASELADRRRGPPDHDEESRPNGLVVVHKDTPSSCLLQSKALCC
jgi:hypothetical protein